MSHTEQERQRLVEVGYKAERTIADLERQLAEANEVLGVIQEWLEPSGVAQHPEVTKARNELRACILKEEK